VAKNVDHIANRLGAKVVAEIPEVGGGAFGAARLSRIVAELQSRLLPATGQRPGRPTDANWVRRPKVPMRKTSERRLERLAKRASASGRKISPMQLAARILEVALSGIPEA